MITVGWWTVALCLLAQVGDGSGRPDARSPRLVPKRTAPAAQFDSQNVDPVDVPEEGRGPDANRAPRGSYPSGAGQRQPERTLDELDPTRREHTGMERVGGGARKLRPPELLAEAIASPADGRIKGRPLALVDVLSRTADRATQRSAAVAYWRLAIAQGQYHYALAARDRLARWAQGQHKVATLAESQLASAEAAVNEAEFGVLKAAQDLSTMVGLEDTDHVPWAIDRPHVGAYDLKFDQLFAGRAAPGRLRLIHRTLPVSRRAIDMHGEAVVAALDALDATEEEYRQSATDYATLASWLDRLTAQRRAFLQSVLRYNEDIAEYAFTVAPAEADAKLLAAILIRQPAKSTHSASPEARGSEGAILGEQSGPPGEREQAPRTFREGESTMEPPLGEPPLGEPADDQPLFEGSGQHAPRRPQFLLVQQRTGKQRGPATGSGGQAGGGKAAGGATAGGSEAYGAPNAGGGQAPPAHGGLYQGLLNAHAAERAERLAELLHWDRELPADSGEKALLAAAIERTSAAERRAAIAGYWKASEQIARYLMLSETGQALAALAPHVLALRSQPGGSSAMLRLQAARQAVGAATLDAQVGLLAAEFELTQLARTAPDRPWLRPATAPFSGSFDLAAHGLRGGKQSPAGPGARLVALHLELENQALAVVFADEYRAQMSGAGEHQAASIEQALAAVERQSRETERFLRALTEYNLAIADVVLPALPPGTPADKVTEVLVPGKRRAAGG